MVAKAAFAHLADVEAARRGMSRSDYLLVLARAIEELYRRRGRIVNCIVDESGNVGALELREDAGVGRWEPPSGPIAAPPAWLVAEHVEQWQADRRRAAQWVLAKARRIATADDHVLVEIVAAHDSSVVGQTAVLPNAFRKPSEIWDQRTPARWLVIQKHFPEEIEGGEAWRSCTANWLASRTEATLVAKVAQNYLHVDFVFESAIHGTAAILICPPATPIGKLLGPQGVHVRQLQDLLGLDRLSVVRQSASEEPMGRLRSAVQHVTGLSGAAFFVQGAAGRRLADGSPALPSVILRKGDLGRFVGRNGCNLFFIRRLSGVSFQHQEAPPEVVSARAESLRLRKKNRAAQLEQSALNAAASLLNSPNVNQRAVDAPDRTGTDALPIH